MSESPYKSTLRQKGGEIVKSFPVKIALCSFYTFLTFFIEILSRVKGYKKEDKEESDFDGKTFSDFVVFLATVDL